MSVDQLDTLLLFGAVVLLVSIAAVRLSVGTGLPSLLIYLGLGLLLGEDALGLKFDHAELAQAVEERRLLIDVPLELELITAAGELAVTGGSFPDEGDLPPCNGAGGPILDGTAWAPNSLTKRASRGNRAHSPAMSRSSP